MFKKIIKGDFNYLNDKRKRVIILTVIYFAIALSLFFAGYLTTHTKKNLLTIVAVLGLLPASKSMVSAIMYIRAKGCSVKSRDIILPHADKLISMFDMYFTSYTKNYSLAHMIVKNKVIIGYSEDKDIDFKACSEHITTMLANKGLKNLTVSLTDDIDKYISMLDNLNKNDENSSLDDEIRISLYEITL